MSDLLKFLEARIEEDHNSSVPMIVTEAKIKRQLIDLAFCYAATIDGEWGCCCSPERIKADLCRDTDVDDLPILLVLAAAYVYHRNYNPEWVVEIEPVGDPEEWEMPDD